MLIMGGMHEAMELCLIRIICSCGVAVLGDNEWTECIWQHLWEN